MDKTTIHMVPEPRKKELVNATYGIIGCMEQGHNQFGPGGGRIHLSGSTGYGTRS
jgi:hypothetical protein